MSGMRKEISKLEKEKAKAQVSNDLKKEVEICNELGELYAQNEQYEEALKEHQQELQLCESASDVIGSAIAHRKIGECHLEMGSFQRAIKHHQKHHSLAKSANSFVEQQRALTTIGRTYLCQADTLENDERLAALEKAKTAFLGSMSVCESHLQGVVSTREYHEMRARIFLNLGLVYEYQNDYNSSIKFIQRAVDISQKNKLHQDLVRCQVSLADIYRCAGELSNSLQSLEKALKVAKEMKNKEKQREIFYLKGTVHFHLGDFVAAKKALKKAYKMGSNSDGEREKVVRALKSAIKCCNLENDIEKAGNDGDQKRALTLEEQFGDTCCKMNSYGLAIQHYKKQLECATALGVPRSEIIPIYVSLAETYADNKQYSSAVEMYRKELKLRVGNPKEECKTWLNVAYAQEQSGQDYDVLQQSYSKAVECAVTAGLPKLQFRALRSLKLVQEHFKEETPLTITIKKLSRLKADHDLTSEDEESDSDDGARENTNSLDTEELDLSASDESEGEQQQEEFDRPLTSRRAQKAKFNKTNEKGETLLHRACIEGNFKQVKSLLEQGHPVNPRDYCGWLPLHEACNHDYMTIVEILLDHGAAINDRGGAQCGGITPLHDAVSCGNIEVAELLIRKGASVIAKDEKGLSPLDTLKKWEENCIDDPESKEKCNQLRQLMIDASKDSRNTVQSTSAIPENNLLDSDLYDNEEDSQSQSQTGSISQSDRRRQTPQRPPPHRMSNSGHRMTKSGKIDSDTQRGTSLRNQRDVSSGSESEGDGDLPSAMDDLPLMRAHPKKHQLGHPSKPTGGQNSLSKKRSQSDSASGMHTSPKLSAATNGMSERSSCIPMRQTEDATTAYRSAMVSIGSSAASRATSKKHPGSSTIAKPSTSRSSKSVGDSLIAEDHYVADDWLIEDMVPSKRRRIDGDVFKRIKSPVDKDVLRETRSPGHQDHAGGVEKTGESVLEETGWADGGFLESEGPVFSDMGDGSDMVFNNEMAMEHDQALTEGVDLSGRVTPSSRNTGNKLARKKKKKQLKLTGIISQRPRSPLERTDDHLGTVPDSPPPMIPPAGPSQEIAYPTVIQSPPSAAASTMRVKVRVQGKVFLISVPLSSPKTIKWLSEETTKRYYAFSGLRPQLSLTTADNALFSPEDVVSEILNNNEEILATVESWELPPLHERYQTQCEKESQKEHPKIKSRIETLDNHNLDLSRLTLKDRPFKPLLSALQCQYALRKLILSYNQITDATIGCLGDGLTSLPNLCHLDLSSNVVSHEGLRRISDAIIKELPPNDLRVGIAGQTAQKPLQHLEELILDYNPLSDSSALYIANIVKHCPLLSKLSLSSTDLTCRFFQLHRTALIEAFQGANYLESLNVSHNALGSAGVKLMLKCLNADKINSLDVSSVIDKPGDGSLVKHFADFFSQQNCTLQKLSLEDCRLNDASMEILSKCIPHTSWTSINLSTNPRITQMGVQTLLQSLKKQGCGLGSLDLSSCGLVSPLDGGIFDLLAGFMSADHPSGETLTKLVLSQNKLNRNDLEVLINVWEAVHGDSARHCVDTVRCTLSIS